MSSSDLFLRCKHNINGEEVYTATTTTATAAAAVAVATAAVANNNNNNNNKRITAGEQNQSITALVKCITAIAKQMTFLCIY